MQKEVMNTGSWMKNRRGIFGISRSGRFPYVGFGSFSDVITGDFEAAISKWDFKQIFPRIRIQSQEVIPSFSLYFQHLR